MENKEKEQKLQIDAKIQQIIKITWRKQSRKKENSSMKKDTETKKLNKRKETKIKKKLWKKTIEEKEF